MTERTVLVKTKKKENKSATEARKDRILVVDGHPVTVCGIRYILANEPDLVISSEAGDIHTALDAVEATKPDLVISEILLKGSNGIELIKNIRTRYPRMPILMVSAHDEMLYSLRCLRAGAQGYIMKQAPVEELRRAIRMVLSGEVYISEYLDRKIRHQQVGNSNKKVSLFGSPIEDLSDRELEVFALVGQGRGPRQIADELELSISTILRHLSGIQKKLGLKTAHEVTLHAFQWREF